MRIRLPDITRTLSRYRQHLVPAAVILLLAFAPEALAQFGLEEAAGKRIPKTQDVAPIIANILRSALRLVGTIFLLLMVYAGFLWMTARGDSKKVDTAKQLIAGAVIGVVIIASAYAITSFVLTSVTGGGGSTPAAPSEEVSECQPRKCVNDSDCSDTNCFTGTCKCIAGGSPPCDSSGGQDGQCVMK